MTCSARSFALAAIGSPAPAGRVPLIGIVQARSPRVCRKSSGVAETIDQPSPWSACAHVRPQRREGGLERPRRAGERRPQVLDEVHLVDVAAADRGAHVLDRGRVIGRASRWRERAGRERPRARAPGSSAGRTRQAASGSGHGSGGCGSCTPAMLAASP